MQSLTSALNGILSLLKEWEMPVVSYLNEGMTETNIRAQFEAAGCVPTQELIDLYSWRNGTAEGPTLGSLYFVPGYHLLSLEEALQCYQDYKDDKRWNSSWLPFMANGGGDFYIADLTNATPEQSPVIGYILGESIQDIEYETINSMMATFHECFTSGAMRKDKKGYLDIDEVEQMQIARKNNPTIEFWKEAS